MTPSVSIVVNNYNYGRYLSSCLDSCLAQNGWPDLEVIVVDDGSTDESRTVLKEFAKLGVDVVVQANQGQAAAFNRGYERASGDLIWFVDSDDALEPNAVSRVVDRWTPGIACLQVGLTVIDAQGCRVSPYPGLEMLEEGDVWARVLTRPGSRSFPYSPTSGLVFSRARLRQIMPLPEGPWRIAADGLLAVLAASQGRFKVLPERLALYRVHGANNWAGAQFGSNVSESERRRLYWRQDAERRRELAEFIRKSYDDPWFREQASSMTREAEAIEGKLALLGNAGTASEPCPDARNNDPLRAPGSPFPPTHLDLWEPVKDGQFRSTKSWRPGHPYAFGMSDNAWTPRFGVASSSAVQCGLRLRFPTSGSHLVTLLLVNQAGEEALDALHVEILGGTAQVVPGRGLHAVQLMSGGPQEASVSIQGVRGGRHQPLPEGGVALVGYAVSDLEVTASPVFPLDVASLIDLLTPMQRVQLARLAMEQGTLFRPISGAGIRVWGNSVPIPSEAGTIGHWPLQEMMVDVLRESGERHSFLVGMRQATCIPPEIRVDLSNAPRGSHLVSLRTPAGNLDESDEVAPSEPAPCRAQIDAAAAAYSRLDETLYLLDCRKNFRGGLLPQFGALPLDFLDVIWAKRPDLQDAFDILTIRGFADYLRWSRTQGAVEVPELKTALDPSWTDYHDSVLRVLDVVFVDTEPSRILPMLVAVDAIGVATGLDPVLVAEWLLRHPEAKYWDEDPKTLTRAIEEWRAQERLEQRASNSTPNSSVHLRGLRRRLSPLLGAMRRSYRD